MEGMALGDRGRRPRQYRRGGFKSELGTLLAFLIVVALFLGILAAIVLGEARLPLPSLG